MRFPQSSCSCFLACILRHDGIWERRRTIYKDMPEVELSQAQILDIKEEIGLKYPFHKYFMTGDTDKKVLQ
jgi:hypothetical protein